MARHDGLPACCVFLPSRIQQSVANVGKITSQSVTLGAKGEGGGGGVGDPCNAEVPLKEVTTSQDWLVA